MDPEQTFLRVHARLSGMLSQLLTPRIRLLLEYVYLGIAFILFTLLVVMHTNFVQQPGCSSELAEINFTDAQLVHIKITSGDLWAQISYEQNFVDFQEEIQFEGSKTPDMNGDGFPIFSTKFWSHWIGSGARRSKLIFKTWKNEKEFLEPQVEKTADTSATKFVPDEISTKAQPEELQKRLPITSREAFRTALMDLCIKLKTYIFSFGKSAKQFSGNGSQIWKTAGWRSIFPDIPKLSKILHIENLNSLLVQWVEKRSKAFEPTYLYTSEKGYFLLPEGAKARHSIQTINVTISAQDSCFGNCIMVSEPVNGPSDCSKD